MKKALNKITKTPKKSEIHERELVYKILFRVFRVFRDQKCFDFPGLLLAYVVFKSIVADSSCKKYGLIAQIDGGISNNLMPLFFSIIRFMSH
jgi:hypothetical protein